MDRDRYGSPLLSRHKSSIGVSSPSSSPAHPASHHVRSASTGFPAGKKGQTTAARAAAQRLAQAMASQVNEEEEEEDENYFEFDTRFHHQPRPPSPQLSRHSIEDSTASTHSASSGRYAPPRAPPIRTTHSTIGRPKAFLPMSFTETSDTNVTKAAGRFPDMTQDDRREAASLHDKIDLLEEEKEDLVVQLRTVEDKCKEAEARAKELEKQVASLGEGVSLEARLISRKEAVLRQREAALRAAEQTKDVKDDEVAALRLDVEAAKDEAATAMEQARNAEAETRSLRVMMQRMILTQEEMEEVVLKRCWLARYWSLAVRYGIHAEIAGAKQEHWSSLAPLPLEVVLSAGQKAKEEPSRQDATAENEDGNNSDRKLRFVRDLTDISSEGNIESMLWVEKGLRELASLKVEDAIMLSMAQERRPNLARVNQDFGALKTIDSPRIIESFELSSQEVEDLQFKQAWLIYFWRRARNSGVEEDIADERLQYWISRNNQTGTYQDVVDAERGLMELRKLGVENQLWEASRREIQEAASFKSWLREMQMGHQFNNLITNVML